MDDQEFDLTTPRSNREREETPLDRLRAKLEKKIERPNRRIGVPERPGISVEVSPNITQAEMRSWRKQAGEGTKKDFDLTLFSTIVLAKTCRGIWDDEEAMTNENGAPLTFASPEIKEMLDVDRPYPEGVRAMFGNDAHVDAAAIKILELAGFGEEIEVADESPLPNS